MANDLSSNPLRIDTADTIVVETSPIYISFFHWCDDDSASGGAMTAADNLVMTINGVRVQYNCVIALNESVSSKFCDPFFVKTLVVNTIDGGTLYIWKCNP